MSWDARYLVYAALFICAALFVEGIFCMLYDVNARMGRAVARRVRRLSNPTQYSVRLRKDAGEAATILGLNLRAAGPAILRLRLQAATTLTMPQLGLVALSASAAIILINLSLDVQLGPSVMLAVIGGPLLPLAYLLRRRRKRIQRFAHQLPDALDLMVRSLRAGHPITTAMSMVARDLEDPIGTEFGIAMDEVTYGLELGQAMDNMCARMPLADLKFVAVALEVQRASGGNLANLLVSLATVIRERFMLRFKIRASSAQGRYAGLVLSLIPFVVGGGIMLVVPGYYGEVMSDPLFHDLLLFAGAALVGGWIWIWRIVNFRV